MLGDRIAEIRRELNMTQKELAARINVTPSAISNYENSYSQPSADCLCQISVCLHVSSDYLLGLTRNRRPADELWPALARAADNERMERILTDLAQAQKAKRDMVLAVVDALLKADLT